MIRLNRSRRPRRSGEWSEARAVTFIVTLAATQNVTLAARRAGMSRKSAYALKQRNSAFAAAWIAALKASEIKRREGNKAHEPHEPPISLSQGDRRSPKLRPDRDRLARKQSFAALLQSLRDSAMLAPGGAA